MSFRQQAGCNNHIVMPGTSKHELCISALQWGRENDLSCMVFMSMSIEGVCPDTFSCRMNNGFRLRAINGQSFYIWRYIVNCFQSFRDT